MESETKAHKKNVKICIQFQIESKRRQGEDEK